MEELKQLIQIQIDNCKKFAGSSNNDYYEGAKDAYFLQWLTSHELTCYIHAGLLTFYYCHLWYSYRYSFELT